MNTLFMDEKSFEKARLYLTGLITASIWSLLAWGHFHGGVPSHHILNRADLPEISNWWGGLLLPLLAWFLFSRTKKRLTASPENLRTAIAGFFSALVFGLSLSAFFTFGHGQICGYMMQGLMLAALFFPIYRSECILGFVLGMTFTFGAILPTGVGLILALMGAGLYLFVRRGFLFLLSKFLRVAPDN